MWLLDGLPPITTCGRWWWPMDLGGSILFVSYTSVCKLIWSTAHISQYTQHGWTVCHPWHMYGGGSFYGVVSWEEWWRVMVPRQTDRVCVSCGLKSLVINRPQLIQLIYSSEVIEWSFFHLEFPESVHLQDCVFVRRNGTEGNGRKIYMDSGFWFVNLPA